MASVSLGPKLEDIVENSVSSDVCMFLTSKITEEFITWMKEQDRKYENKGTFQYINQSKASVFIRFTIFSILDF